MIKKFYVRNFRSILDLTLDMNYAEGKAPNGWQEDDSMPFISDGVGADDNRVSPVLVLYGANASGKTNIIQAISQFLKIVRRGLRKSYRPNQFNRKYASTIFAIDYAVDGVNYSYLIEYDGNGICREELKSGRDELQGVYSIKDGKPSVSDLVTETYPDEKLQEIFKVECTSGSGKQIKTFLACLGENYQPLSREVTQAYRALRDTVRVNLSNRVDIVEGIELLSSGVNNSEARRLAQERVAQYLRKFDLSIEGFEIETRKLSDDEFYELLEKEGPINGAIRHRQGRNYLERVTSVHRGADGQLAMLDFLRDESDGTKLLAGIIALCLYALDNGLVVAFDELDRSLHPLVLVEIVKMFKLRRYNPHGAQLIITAHDSVLMEDSLLRLGEIGIVNNNVHSGTKLARLVDMRNSGMDIRNVHNFRKMYMEGLLSGIPYPCV